VATFSRDDVVLLETLGGDRAALAAMLTNWRCD
jgi:hypothetical protein